MRGTARFKLLIGIVLIATILIYTTQLFNSSPQTAASELIQTTVDLQTEMEHSQRAAERRINSLRQEIARDMAYLASQLNVSRFTAINNDYKILHESPKRALDTDKTHLIVEYTHVFFQPKFCDFSSERIFNSALSKCKYQNCKYTCDKSAGVLDKASALIFHQRDLEHELVSQFKSNTDDWLRNTKQFPFRSVQEKLKRNPNAVWILWNDEATPINKSFNKLSPFFNWTLSFRTNSEVYEGSYGFFENRNPVKPEQLRLAKTAVYENEFKKRKNSILWFVNNCLKSRLQVAFDISKFYPVTVYTSCVLDDTEQALYPNLRLVRDKCDKDSSCEKTQFSQHKYYLAFENTNCSDYVTEKIWKALGGGMIPIVYQPSRESYGRLGIPDKSFVHMEDFGFSAKSLADYLRRVDGNFDLFYEYVKWSRVYLRVRFQNEHTEPHRMCQMCRKLNEYATRVEYKNLASFFNDQCVGY
jgi:hypothetical protein